MSCDSSARTNATSGIGLPASHPLSVFTETRNASAMRVCVNPRSARSVLKYSRRTCRRLAAPCGGQARRSRSGCGADKGGAGDQAHRRPAEFEAHRCVTDTSATRHVHCNRGRLTTTNPSPRGRTVLVFVSCVGASPPDGPLVCGGDLIIGTGMRPDALQRKDTPSACRHFNA